MGSDSCGSGCSRHQVPWKLTGAHRSCIVCAIFTAWMLNASRGVATTCVTGENAADATRCWIDISFFSTVRAPDLGYYSRVGPRNVKAADNYVGLRRWTRERGTTNGNEKNAAYLLPSEVLKRPSNHRRKKNWTIRSLFSKISFSK